MKLSDCQVHSRFYVNMNFKGVYPDQQDRMVEDRIRGELTHIIFTKENLIQIEIDEKQNRVIYQADLYVFTSKELDELITKIERQVIYKYPIIFPPEGV